MGIVASALLPAILDNAAGPCPDGKNAALQCVQQYPLWPEADINHTT
jgi:hypothetical protein